MHRDSARPSGVRPITQLDSTSRTDDGLQTISNDTSARDVTYGTLCMFGLLLQISKIFWVSAYASIRLHEMICCNLQHGEGNMYVCLYVAVNTNKQEQPLPF